jgi:next-to-BRCA1 protein 1
LGRFVKESIGDKFEIQAGGKFTKSWVIRNDGETAWPMCVTFIQVSGDDLGASSVPLGQIVAPQTEYTWEVGFTAPQKSGRYTAFFRM